MDDNRTIRIGGASGFWGDAALATGQLLGDGGLDYIVYDYLAEITMGILARMRARDPAAGFATDFVTQAMAPNLAEISRQGVKVISNAGGVNPVACVEALRGLIRDQGLPLTVACVTGDDLMARRDDFSGHSDMFTGAPFPPADRISSINAYLGAFPIAAALATGADIVITGRCVDSAVTLAACAHEFGWQAEEFDLLAAGSLAGHILECGTQATGGNFTDWRDVGDMAAMGYPIAEIRVDGEFILTKPAGTDGLVSVGTVAEQMLYEIGDPQAYILPDVVCDFSQVSIVATGVDHVRVKGAQGRAPTDSYKTCLTWQDGFRGGHLFTFYGLEAEEKAGAFADSALRRGRLELRRRNMPDFTEVSVEVLGAESQFGVARESGPAREVNVKIAAKHPQAAGIALLMKEATGLALSAPPGLSGFAGARPKPSPVMALFSFLLPKDKVGISVVTDEGNKPFLPATFRRTDDIVRPTPPAPAYATTIEVPLIELAFARSGDKGDSANIGVIARRAEFMPYIWAGLDEATLMTLFGHFLQGDIQRFYLPGCNAMNILMSRVLGGGGSSSLRNDPQGKGYAQLLLAHRLAIPETLLEN
jgi:acyclic terpene utilization AtuA family protein